MLQWPIEMGHFIAWHRFEELKLTTFRIQSATVIEAFAAGLAGYAVSGMLEVIYFLVAPDTISQCCDENEIALSHWCLNNILRGSQMRVCDIDVVVRSGQYSDSAVNLVRPLV